MVPTDFSPPLSSGTHPKEQLHAGRVSKAPFSDMRLNKSYDAVTGLRVEWPALSDYGLGSYINQ
jgi:hypothetical protein